MRPSDCFEAQMFESIVSIRESKHSSRELQRAQRRERSLCAARGYMPFHSFLRASARQRRASQSSLRNPTRSGSCSGRLRRRSPDTPSSIICERRMQISASLFFLSSRSVSRHLDADSSYDAFITRESACASAAMSERSSGGIKSENSARSSSQRALSAVSRTAAISSL